MEDVLNIPGSIHSISQEGNAVYANEVFDKRKNKKQQLVNQETDEELDNHGQRIGTLEEAVGEGGSVDERIAQAKSEAESDIKGGASEDYDTLKKAEDAIKSEVNAREGAVSDEASARQDAINTAKTEIIGGASTDCNTLGKAEIKISTNAQDIAQLQAAYEALTQSTPVIVEPTDTWPVANPQQNIIYRVVDRVNTPPQYYEDYMYNGTAMVLMARYNNAIDPRPKKGSQNLVSSGGVFDNMGALDVSELNATENPHTLATYADLSAALATIPSDYQKGGMSIKFVQSSDNKYVQFRYMGTDVTGNPNPFLDTANWQGVDDEPTAGSDNLVKSGGVYPLETNLNALNEKSSINLVLGEQKSGYYNGSITPVANNGIYYDGVDVSNYSVILVTFNNASDASGRQIITAKKDGTIVATYKEMDYIEADGVYRNIIPLTEDVYFIYISCNQSATNITATGYVREYSNAEGKETEKSLNTIRSNTRNLFNANLMPVLNSWTGITSFVIKGEYYFSGQATETASKYSEKIILPQGSYVFSVGTEKQIHGYIRLFDSEDNVLETIMLNNTVKSAIVTISANVAYAYWSIGGISGVNYGDGTNLKLMIESGTELSAYIPHDTAIDTVAREKVAVIEDEIKELKGVDELVFGTQKSGYYNGSVTPVENNGIYYDPVNIENYFKLDITFDNAASASGRMILVTDANDNILASYKEMDYIQGNKYTNTINLPGSAAKLYVSYNTSATNLKVIGYERMEKTICYVSTTGSDSNDGLTRATPFLTIQKALNEGYKTILVKEGVYTNMISMEGLSGVKVMLDRMYDTYTALTDEDNPKFVIDGTANSLQKGLYMYDCQNCVISDIEIRNCTIKGIEMDRCENIRFDDCAVHDIGVANPTGSVGGYALTYVSADFYNCVAYNIGTTQAGQGSVACDGFNIHGTGVTNFINCSAWNCEDDGISHHDACYGLVDGGEWYNCGKGGICTPTHGAKVNIQNVYSHDNLYGIYAFKPDGYATREKLIFSNCVCKSNSADIEVNRYQAVLINCVYDRLVGQEFVTVFTS